MPSFLFTDVEINVRFQPGAKANRQKLGFVVEGLAGGGRGGGGDGDAGWGMDSGGGGRGVRRRL